MQISNSTPVISIYLRGFQQLMKRGESVSGNSAFELQSNNTIDIDSVSIVSLAEESIGYQLFDKSTANITNSSIFPRGR